MEEAVQWCKAGFGIPPRQHRAPEDCWETALDRERWQPVVFGPSPRRCASVDQALRTMLHRVYT